MTRKWTVSNVAVWCGSLVVALAGLAVLAGCETASRAYTDHSQDADRYAQHIKQMVAEIVAEAPRQREPADLLIPLVQELQETTRPRGQYGDVYRQLLEKAQALRQACEQSPSGRPSDLSARLAELAQLADQLPGEAGSEVMYD